jgi:uncharacterized protein (TIGR02596 family)
MRKNPSRPVQIPSFASLPSLVMNTHRRHAFTLIEVLVVLAIVGILMGLTVPGMTGVLKGSKITQSADQLVQDIALARQTAVKENVPVEFRFYRISDPMATGSGEEEYSAYQAYKMKVDLNTPSDYTKPRIGIPVLPKIQRFPLGVVLVNDQKWSTLVAHESLVEKREQVRGLVTGQKDTDAAYKSFTLTPDGETGLDRSSTQWFLTFVTDADMRKAGSAASLIPTNFITVQVDPFTGNTRVYQP